MKSQAPEEIQLKGLCKIESFKVTPYWKDQAGFIVEI